MIFDHYLTSELQQNDQLTTDKYIHYVEERNYGKMDGFLIRLN